MKCHYIIESNLLSLVLPFLHVKWSPTFFFLFPFIIRLDTVVVRLKWHSTLKIIKSYTNAMGHSGLIGSFVFLPSKATVRNAIFELGKRFLYILHNSNGYSKVYSLPPPAKCNTSLSESPVILMVCVRERII